MSRNLRAIQLSTIPVAAYLFRVMTSTVLIGTAVLVCGIGVARCDQSFGIPSRQPRPIASEQIIDAANVVTPSDAIALSSSKVSGGPLSDSTTERFLPNPAIVRIVAFETVGQLYGSGTYIGSVGQYGLIVSNWHVVSGTDVLVHVHFPTGFASFGYVLLTDRKWDLAVIVVSRPPATVTPLVLAREVPRPGDPLWIAGYGAGMFRVASGRCQRYLAPEIPAKGQPQYEYVELSVEARQGDSGGPILNRYGEVAGVLFGSDSRNTAGSHCGRVRLFLDQAAVMLNKLPPQPEGLFASVEKDGPRHPLSMTSFPLVVAAIADREKVSTALGGMARPASASFGIVSISHRHDPDTAPLPPPHGLVPNAGDDNAFPQSVVLPNSMR